MSKRKRGFLDSAYGLESPEKRDAFYDRWAKSYDDELTENGYVTPSRCAQALANHISTGGQPMMLQPVVDLGCGTGLSGLALRAFGFDVVDGFDYSEQMLEQAAAREDGYRRTGTIDVNQPLDAHAGQYAHAIAAGVISPGHAPAEVVTRMLKILPPGGLVVFSLNDHALANAEYAAIANNVVRARVGRLRYENYGDHIPGTGLRARVYGLQHLG
jgi:predicted TPR repeat methyltransferase